MHVCFPNIASAVHSAGAFLLICFVRVKSMYVKANPNPSGAYVGDCVIRAISVATGLDWERTYVELAMQGFVMTDMPSSNRVWGAYLKSKGFERHQLPDTCPDCYTVKAFCEEHPDGVYIVATGMHVVAVVNGSYYDAWDSGDEVAAYYFTKEE